MKAKQRYKQSSWYVIGIISLLFIILITNYLDRSAIAYAIKPIRQNLHLNNTEFGAIAGAFGIGYLLMPFIGGILVDHYGARKVLAFSIMAWSIVCILLGFANDYWSLFILRICLGIAEGPCFPALTQVIASWLTVKQRVRAMAFSLAAVPFASVIGAPILTHLIILFNWRIMFIILGCIGFILGIVWYVVYRDKFQVKHATPTGKGILHKMHLRPLLTNPAILANNYAYFCYGYMLFFALNWLPGYLAHNHAVTLRQLGWLLTLPWLTGTVLLVSGGFLSDYLYKKTRSIRIARSHIIWICQSLSAGSFLLVIISNELWSTILGISLAIGFGLMPNAIFYSLNIDLMKQRAATSQGLMNSCTGISGILAPWLTGWLVHITGSFMPAIIFMMVLMLTSILSIIFFQKVK